MKSLILSYYAIQLAVAISAGLTSYINATLNPVWVALMVTLSVLFKAADRQLALYLAERIRQDYIINRRQACNKGKHTSLYQASAYEVNYRLYDKVDLIDILTGIFVFALSWWEYAMLGGVILFIQLGGTIGLLTALKPIQLKILSTSIRLNKMIAVYEGSDYSVHRYHRLVLKSARRKGLLNSGVMITQGTLTLMSLFVWTALPIDIDSVERLMLLGYVIYLGWVSSIIYGYWTGLIESKLVQ